MIRIDKKFVLLKLAQKVFDLAQRSHKDYIFALRISQ